MSGLHEQAFALNKSFFWKYHKLRHTGEKPFKCGLFEKIFRKMPELTSH